MSEDSWVPLLLPCGDGGTVCTDQQMDCHFAPNHCRSGRADVEVESVQREGRFKSGNMPDMPVREMHSERPDRNGDPFCLSLDRYFSFDHHHIVFRGTSADAPECHGRVPADIEIIIRSQSTVPPFVPAVDAGSLYHEINLRSGQVIRIVKNRSVKVTESPFFLDDEPLVDRKPDVAVLLPHLIFSSFRLSKSKGEQQEKCAEYSRQSRSSVTMGFHATLLSRIVDDGDKNQVTSYDTGGGKKV